MKPATALIGVAALVIGGVLAVGVLAAATATADPCPPPPSGGPPAAAQALRVGQGALAAPATAAPPAPGW